MTSETTTTTSAATGRREAVLSFDDVSKTFPDGTFALGSTTFDVARGEFVTIVGPSGCGKSTLLRIASGLDAPSTGSVTVDHASLGYVFQDATLLPWRDVRRNVQLFAELDGMGKSDMAKRVAENVRLVGLEGNEDKYPKQLSGGMRMRASLARSLVMEPDIFLFDEPFGALDEITRERLNDELLGLFQRKGFGALFITHSISEAVFLSTRVLVMSQRPGRILAELRGAVPVPPLARPALRAGLRRALGRGQPRPAGSARVTSADLSMLEPAVATEELPPPSTTTQSGRFRWSVLVGPLVTLAVFLALWEYMHRDGMRRFFDKPGFLLPSPVTVINDSFLDATVRGQMIEGLGWTALATFVGLAISMVLGVTIGVLMAQAEWIERSMYPYLVALQAIPVLAVVPLILSVFGGGIGSRIFVCVMISIFPIVTATLFGLTSVDPSQHDLFSLRRASRRTRLLRCSSRRRCPPSSPVSGSRPGWR